MTHIEDIRRVAGYLPVAAALVNAKPSQTWPAPRGWATIDTTTETPDTMAATTPDLIAELVARSRLDNSLDMADTKALHALYISLGQELAIRAAVHSFPDLAGADEFIDSQLDPQEAA